MSSAVQASSPKASLLRGLRATFKVYFLAALFYARLSKLTAPDFIVPDAEFEALNKMDRNKRYNFPFRWGVDIFGEVGAEEAERRAEEHAAAQR